MKKFLQKLFLLFPIPLIIILTNYFYDPAHLYSRGKYEQKIASYLLLGKNVSNVTNYDVKLLQKYYILGLKTPKDTIVLGSSRALTLQKDLFPNQSFFNNSINGASMEDYRFVWENYLIRKLIPHKIILGLDPWILNKSKYNQRDESQKELTQKVNSFILAKTNLTPTIERKYLELLSPPYFQSSFSLFLKRISGSAKDEDIAAINDTSDKRVVKYEDGSMNMKSRYNDTSEKVQQTALTFDPVPLLGNFDRLDPIAASDLESLITQMQAHGSQVIFYLPPYHPITYNTLISQQKYKIIDSAQKYFISLAKEKGIDVYGSYNPDDYKLTQYDFYDGSHPNESAAKKIFQKKLF